MPGTQHAEVMSTDYEPELLTHDEEIALAVDIEAGLIAAHALANGENPCEASNGELQFLAERGEAARRRLYLANLALVRQRAGYWAKRLSVSYQELFQEGCVGLGEAIARFDHSLGHRFSTFAHPLVDGRIAQHAQTRCGTIEFTRHRVRSVLRYQRAGEELAQRLARQPRPEEIADHLGVRRSVVRATLEIGMTPVSVLDEDLPDSAELTECLPGSDMAWFDRLGEYEQMILSARFGLGQPPVSRRTLAERLGASVSTVRREELRALSMARRVILYPSSPSERMGQWHDHQRAG